MKKVVRYLSMIFLVIWMSSMFACISLLCYYIFDNRDEVLINMITAVFIMIASYILFGVTMNYTHKKRKKS